MWYIYAMENYSVIKRNKLLKHAARGEPEKHAKWKKSHTKDYVLYDSMYMRCPEKTNF